MKFQKYSSINNSYSQKYIDLFRESIHLLDYNEKKIYVTEKRHGCNFSFIISENKIQCGKRSGIILENESFYNYEVILKKYEQNLKKLFSWISLNFDNIESVSVFGEMFGGAYPHKDVEKNNHYKPIQKGVYYTPDIEFEAFDILLRFKDGYISYIDQDYMFGICETFKIPVVPLIQICDTLEEALSIPVENIKVRPLDSLSAKTNTNLPEIENNYIEGYVIKPNKYVNMRNGERAILKTKTENFSEKSRKAHNPVKEKLPEYLLKFIEEGSLFVTENRLNNVISKTGHDPFYDFKMLGKIIGEFTKDVIEDFIKENDEFLSLEKSEQKKVTKEITGISAKFIKDLVFKRNMKNESDK